MYSGDMLKGVLISLASPDVNIVSSSKSSLGYRVRVRVCIRGKADFLKGIKRSLLQHEVESNYKDSEHKARPRPILVISGLQNLTRLVEMLPLDLPTNGEWRIFTKTLQMLVNKEHLSEKGLFEIIKMKEGTNALS